MSDKASVIEALKKQLHEFKSEAKMEHVGTVLEVGDGIARISGLSEVMASEMIEFSSQSSVHGSQPTVGVVLNLEDGMIGAMILGDYTDIKEGDTVKSTGKVFSIPVGEAFVGRVVDPLGRPLDGKGAIKSSVSSPVEKIAPGVIFRAPVNTPLQTGIKAIDSMIPVGRGQRELIIGDRQVGKTAVAIDTIINQKGQDVTCIYVAIGQKESKVAKIVAKLEEAGAMEHTIVVVSGASAPAALSFIAPYAGCALGEYFMEHGKDALIVCDDLSKHAWA